MKSYKCDVLVVGGGPAGSNAARYAAKGADVILIEKKKEIGAPVSVLKVFPKEYLKSLR